MLHRSHFGAVTILLWLIAQIASGGQVVQAQDTASCNRWLTGQSILLAENYSLSLDGQIEMARVIVTHGACDLDPHFYASYAAALRARANGTCYRSWACWVYFHLDEVSLDLRATPAMAMHLALTEQVEGQAVPRYHFDDEPSAERCGWRCSWWWNANSCPNGFMVIGNERVC